MREKKSTIGRSPFDLLIPVPEEANKKGKKTMVPENQVQNGGKSRLTTYITHTTIERVKNAVFWTPGLTLADFTERALIKAIDDIEGGRGEHFPQRSSDLKKGRPIR